MNYNKITNKIRTRYLINIFLLVGFVLVVTRLEKYFNKAEDYSYNPVLVNNELVINEQPNDELIIKDDTKKQEGKSCNVEDAKNIYSYTFTIIAYNSLIHNKFGTIVSNHISHIKITSILQKNNIWHKSLGEKPAILS
jgi:hypothetical protein